MLHVFVCTDRGPVGQPAYPNTLALLYARGYDVSQRQVE